MLSRVLFLEWFPHGAGFRVGGHLCFGRGGVPWIMAAAKFFFVILFVQTVL